MFYASTGARQPLSVAGERREEFPFQLGPRSARAFPTDGNSEPLFVGWAEVTADFPFTGSVLFSLEDPSGKPLAEAGVGSSVPARTFTAHVSRNSGLGTSVGVAVANPLDRTVTVQVEIKDELGQVVVTDSFDLGSRQQRARFVQEMGELPSNFEGVLVLSASVPVVVTLLRTVDGIHSSSLPVGP